MDTYFVILKIFKLVNFKNKILILYNWLTRAENSNLLFSKHYLHFVFWGELKHYSVETWRLNCYSLLKVQSLPVSLQQDPWSQLFHSETRENTFFNRCFKVYIKVIYKCCLHLQTFYLAFSMTNYICWRNFAEITYILNFYNIKYQVHANINTQD